MTAKWACGPGSTGLLKPVPHRLTPLSFGSGMMLVEERLDPGSETLTEARPNRGPSAFGDALATLARLVRPAAHQTCSEPDTFP